MLCSLASAKVQGNLAEVNGTNWDQLTFKSWVEDSDALMTPETSNLAAQSCLRNSQEQLDAVAYSVAEKLAKSLSHYYRVKGTKETRYDDGLRALTQLTDGILAIPTAKNSSRKSYEDDCGTLVEQSIRRDQSRLETVFYGRLYPKTPPELASHGLKVAPLTWNGLKDQICKLEGYYSTSQDPRLWKFFSLTRSMSNVLPPDSDNDAFLRTVKRWPAPLTTAIRTLNLYSSVAGKYNGASIGMTDAQMKSAPIRKTGVALGSRAASLMAFFTTGWREKLQADITSQIDYPQVPFQLISNKQVLAAVAATHDDPSRKGRSVVQTELGMDLVFDSLLPLSVHAKKDDSYGAETESYKATAALAWLALNAETNIRQNEKLGGLAGSAVPVTPDLDVFGSPTQYQAVVNELDAALAAYRAIDPKGSLVPGCVKELQQFNQAAMAIGDGKLGKVAQSLNRVFNGIEFEPVIADIGEEVEDKDAGIFRLHLAIGYGHSVITTVGGKEVKLWTPSAMVLHLPKTTATGEWQQSLVKNYEK